MIGSGVRDPERSSTHCQTHDGFDVYPRAVDQWKIRGLLIEDQSQIGPSKHDGFDAPVVQKPLTDDSEYRPLRIGDHTRSGHSYIGVMDIIQVIVAWWDDLGRSNASKEARFHDCPSS